MAKATRLPVAPPIKAPKRPTPPDQIPRVIAEPRPDDHLEVITRAIFQAGLSWAMIGARWPAFRAAFEDFAIERVARYGEFELDRLMHAEGIIHSSKKITATFANANTLLALANQYGSISAYVATFASYAELYRDAHARLAFLGDLNCYYWLLRTGNPVPLFEDWIARQAADHPRMREMVVLARATGVSSERAGF